MPQQPQQDTHVVAIHCGEKGLSVCGVRAYLGTKRPSRQFVVTGFELITDNSYSGTRQLPVLSAMVQRSQVLNNVFTQDPDSYVVLLRHSPHPDAGNLAVDALRQKQRAAERISSSIRQLHPNAQVLDILLNSTNTAVKQFLQQHPRRNAQAAVAAGNPAALRAARTFNTSEYGKAKRKTRDNLVDAAKTFLGSSRVSMADLSDAVGQFEQFSKPVANIRDTATAFWMALYALDQKPAQLVLKSSPYVQPGDGAAAPAAAAGAAAAAAGGGPAAAPAVPVAPATAGLPVTAQHLAALLPAVAQLHSLLATASGAAGLHPSARQGAAAAAPGAAAAGAAGAGAATPGAGAAATAGAVAAVGVGLARTGGASGAAGTNTARTTLQGRRRTRQHHTNSPAAAAGGGAGTQGTPRHRRHRGRTSAAAAAAAAGGRTSPEPFQPLTQPQGDEAPVQHRSKRRRTNTSTPTPFVDLSAEQAVPSELAGTGRRAVDVIAIDLSDDE